MSLLRSRFVVGFSTCALCALVTFGCKDQQKCDDALSTARKSMQDEFLDMELARKWRDHAGKACGQGATLTTLDSEILAREAELVKKAADQAKKEADDGAKALEAAKKKWADWDKLEDDEKDKKSLKKTKKSADKTVNGLTEAYAKQVLDFNTSRYDRRLKKVEKDAK